MSTKRKRSIVFLAIISLMATAAFLLPANPAAAVMVNLIENGSFEIHVEDPSTWSISGVADFLGVGNTDMASWTVIKGNIDYVTLCPHVPPHTWQAADGEASLDLCGSPGSGGVSQTFATTADATYEVRFYMSGNPMEGYTGPPNKTLRVQATGQFADFSFDVAAEQNSFEEMKWKLCTFTFVADSNSTTLEIFSTMENVHKGPVIDSVSVAAVEDWPIAGTWIEYIPPWQTVEDPGIILHRLTPLDPAGNRLLYAQTYVNVVLTLPPPVPPVDYVSDLVGEAVKTGLNAYEYTLTCYGAKRQAEPGQRCGEITLICVISGRAELLGPDHRYDTYMYKWYSVDRDVDPADGFPDEGQEPIMVLGPLGHDAYRRVPLIPLPEGW